MRKVMYVVGALVIVLLLAIVILPFVIDVNQFRPRIESAASAALGRKVDIGNIRLSILSGGVAVDDLAVADDPAFNSGPFLKAKGVTVSVELMPLIFSRQLHVTGLTIDAPEVTLLHNASGVWNFSSMGASQAGAASASPGTQPKSAETSGAAPDVSVARFSIKNGTVSIGNVGANPKRHSYDQLSLDATDLSLTAQFPFDLSLRAPGNGTVKLTGNVGPMNAADAEQTPLSATLDVHGLDLAATGFIDPASGISGLVDFTGSLTSDGQKVDTKGAVTATKLQLVPGGSPAGEPIKVDYETEYQLKPRTGTLKQGDVHIGKALARLSGAYNTAGETTSVQMKVGGTGMPATDLEKVLPALGIVLPSGASLTEGTLDVNLTVTGPTTALVTSGPINLSNAKLSGFDLGAKMGGLSSFAGVPKGSDTVIQTLSSTVRIAPDGIRTDNLNLVVPAIGSLAGSGTMDAKQALDYKMTAKLTSGAMGSITTALSGGQKGGGIPFKIQGTASNPTFVPDMQAMAGAAGNLAKGLATNSTKGINVGGQDLGGAIGGLLGKKKAPTQ